MGDRKENRDSRINRSAALVLACLLIGGFLLRWPLVSNVPLHGNNHGLRQITALVDPGTPTYIEQFYSRTHPLIVKPLVGLLGGTEQAVFALSAFFGALAGLFLFRLAMLLGFGGAGGLLAVLMFVAHPALVRLHGSEAPFALFQLLSLSGLVLMVEAIRRRSLPRLWAAAALLTLAGSLRVLTVLILPAAGLVALAELKTAPEGRLRYHGLRLAVVMALVVGLHFVEIAGPIFSYSGHSGPNKLLLSVTSGNLLLDPLLTPVPLLLLAGLGVAALWRRDRRRAWLLLGLALLLIPPGYLVNSYRSDGLRYQPMFYWLLCLMAGAVLGPATLRRLSTWPGRAAVVVAGLVIILGAGWGMDALRRGNIEVLEHRFLQDQQQTLEPGTWVHLPEFVDQSRKHLVDFPGYLVKGYWTQEPPGLGDVVWLGLDCYRLADEGQPQEFLPDGLLSECSRVCEEGRLFPVRETVLSEDLPDIGYQRLGLEFSSEEPRVGFYRCL